MTLKSNKTLFLLTKTYPFGHGEQYITNELPFLSQQFEKVIIYPNDYYNIETERHRVLPNNVEVLNFNQTIFSNSSNSTGDYFYLIKNTFEEYFKTDDKKYFLKNFKWNLVNFWTQLQIAKRLAIYLKENNYNSSNSVFYSYWFHKSAILLSILKDKNHIQKFVARAHSIDLYHQNWGIINEKIKVPPFKMFKLKHATAIFPVSQHGTDHLKSKYYQYQTKITTHYLGVADIEPVNGKTNEPAFHIVTCSGIDFNKRVGKLAEALLQIKDQVLWTHFGNGNLLVQLEQIIKQLPENITVHLKGSTPNLDIQNFYKNNKIDLFVNLSIVEGLPVSIMEAMVHEIPILATQVYGTPEAVIEGKNGFLVGVNFSIDELAQKLNYCIENVNLLREMGLNSRKLFLEKYSSEKNYTQFANNLASL